MYIKINGECRPEELMNLFESVGWVHQDLEKLNEAFRYSWRWITVRDEDNRLIGFARILSEGIRHANICNMAISPENQKKGIGQELLISINNLLKKNNLLPSLVTTPGNQGFYKNFGFRTEDNGFTAMCIRK
jgi:N-acetylglutamate synthase-like GNAT family acetyltransferase